MTIAVLFTREKSNYRLLPGVDLYPASRDARTYAGDYPVIAHPPCRGWGRLRTFANIRPDELDLARFAVATVRRCGGVLEHPAYSQLWPDQQLPRPGQRDAFGGFTFPLLQGDFGHRAPKPTWLYVVGIEPSDMPSFDLVFDAHEGRIELMGKGEREATPLPFCLFLLDLAARCDPRRDAGNSRLSRQYVASTAKKVPQTAH